MTWSVVSKKDSGFRLKGCPRYRGFIARRYGPGISLPRQSDMFWHMSSRAFMVGLEMRNRVEMKRRRTAI